jgi:hypothetical protein
MGFRIVGHVFEIAQLFRRFQQRFHVHKIAITVLSAIRFLLLKFGLDSSSPLKVIPDFYRQIPSIFSLTQRLFMFDCIVLH